MTTFNLKQGDRLPKLRMQLSDSAPIDLTGGTLAFRMRRRDSPTWAVLTGTATVVTAATGIVEYAWGDGDTATPGVYDALWVVTFATLPQTIPSTGHVVVVIEPV